MSLEWEKLKNLLINSEYYYFHTKNGVLLRGDCIEVLKLLPDNSIDLIITDPPYGVNYQNSKYYRDDKNYMLYLIKYLFEYLHRIAKNSSHLYMYVSTLEIDVWVSHLKQYFNLKNIISVQTKATVKIKNNFDFSNQPILFAHKGRGRDFNEVDWIPTSEGWLKDKRNKNKNPFTYKYPSFNKFYKASAYKNRFVSKKISHKSAKNLDLIKNFVLISSDENDVVIDPFLGSGTTALACELTGRRWIGIEIDENYCEVSKKRILELINQGGD